MLRRLSLLAILAVSFQADSGQLLINATILEVANTAGNHPEFAVRTTGGTGVCSNETWIIFPESKKQSDYSYQQAFSIALTALTSNKKVRIHNFEDDNCSEANFISIYK